MRRFTEPLAVERTRDLEVVGPVVLVRDNLLNLGSAVGGDLGGNLAHNAASAEFGPVIFDFHASYISRATSLLSDLQSRLWTNKVLRVTLS